LPTYPFAEKRFWLSAAVQQAVGVHIPPKPKAIAYDFTRPAAVNIETKAVEKPIKTGEVKTKVLYNFASAEKTVAAESTPITATNTPLFDKVQQELLSLLAGILKINPRDMECDMAISEYNLDSIVLTDYVGKINDKYDINIMPMVLVDYSTINAFAAYLTQEYAEAIADYYA
jgi:acyl carrier protein